MLSSIPNSVSKIYVHTGNILNLNEIKKLAGQNQTDEVRFFLNTFYIFFFPFIISVVRTIIPIND